MTNENEQSRLSRNDIHSDEIKRHLERINHEFDEGFEFLKRYPKSVTIFGSSQARPEEEHYKKAEELAGRIVRELNYAVATGGGPGIMEAGNKGAFEAGGISLGFNISLPHERVTNAYATHSMKFAYFFSRKTMLVFAAEACVFFPGGFGTLDELFNILTLIQGDKVPRVPVILYDSNYWSHLRNFLKDHALNEYHALSEEHLNLFEITDSLDRIIEIIKKAPVSEWWRNIN